MARIKSNKYRGVYKNQLINGDISYYITYKDNNNKLVWVNIGRKSNGITEKFCYTKRSQYINQIKIDDDPLKHKKKKTIITLNDVANKYFKSLGLTSSQKVIEDLRGKYNNHLKLFHNKEIIKILSSDIENMQILLSKSYAPKTNNMMIDLFSTIFNYGLKKELYNIVNPASKVKRLKIDNKRERFLSINEIKQLDTKLENKLTLKLFIHIALSTGARLGSILAIKRKDINLEHKQIIIKDFKNNKTYTAYMTTKLLQLLNSNIKDLNPNDYVVSLNGNKMTDRELQNRLKPILDRLFNKGLEANDRINRVVIHTLRHTFASHLAIKGVSQFKIQILMNHSKAEMTERYTKLSPNSGKLEVEKLYNL